MAKVLNMQLSPEVVRFYPLMIGATLAVIANTTTAFILGFATYAPSTYLRIALISAIISFFLQIILVLTGRHEEQNRMDLLRSAKESKKQTDELFAMTDMLQSAEGYDDATAVLEATSLRLLPQFGAALYIFNNSRDRLDLAGSWNLPPDYQPSETLAPTNCWALKRGKPHINDTAAQTLCCSHHNSRIGTVEVPMSARGIVHGLFILAYDGENSYAKLKDVRRAARAVADSMSLALSNIALHEKLRTQSMRDPLTGLYNRRYMEDALERYLSLAERSGNCTSVLMVDLDDFKRLNDEHGHAKGDAVLRDVAAQMIGGVRPSDVVCRYGGEEFLIILPSCSLDDAADKADLLRARIEMLSETHQVRVSASFGVATVPTTATTVTDIVPMADNALYQAKRAGKNRVECAEPRAGKEEAAPRLAVTG